MITRLITSVLVLIAALPAVPAAADDALRQEQKLKAAFIYNFVKFVEWPDEKSVSKDTPITIGIIGSQDFVKAFDSIKHAKIKDRRIVIKYLAGYEKLKKPSEADDPKWQQQIKALEVCEVLMLGKSETVQIENPTQIVKALQDSPVLTIGETDGFLESGGMINFIKQGKKVRFEVNHRTAKRAGLHLRSQFLRLAHRVIAD